MKKAIIAIYLSMVASVVFAACTTQTVTYNGRMMTCTTCCFGNNCNTNCI
jgi:hypothetical protein